jgi:hypothetical protein
MSTTLTANWSAVTTDSAGQPLSTPIKEYDVSYYLGDVPLTGTQPLVKVAAPATTLVVPNLPNGGMGFRVRAVDDNDVAGAWSSYASGVSQNPPGVPGNVTVTLTQ